MMKKLLFFLIVASNVAVQGTTHFKYLSKMDEESIIRRECEQVERAWIIKGKKEIVCDKIDLFIKKCSVRFFKKLNEGKTFDKKEIAKKLLESEISEILHRSEDFAPFLNAHFTLQSDNDSKEKIDAEIEYLIHCLRKELNRHYETQRTRIS